jgi:ketosteroid isomerase-like protein
MKIMKRIMEATPVWLVGVLLFLAGIGIGFFVTPGSGSARAAFVEDGPLYDGQKKLLGEFVAAFLRRDAKGCGDLYTEDAVYMIPETPALEGSAAILENYKEQFRVPPSSKLEMSEPVAEVLAMGDWAVVRGTGSSAETIDGDVETKTYKWIILSQRQDDGTWKMVWDIFNYDDPHEDTATEE